METLDLDLETKERVLDENGLVKRKEVQAIGTDLSFKREIVWKNAIGFLILHLMAVYGFFLAFSAYSTTIWWSKYIF